MNNGQKPGAGHEPPEGCGTCATCKWWVQHQQLDNIGDCHGAPPSLHLVTQQNRITGQAQRATMPMWHVSARNDWCRNHEPAARIELAR